ncbi:MAG: transglutaminase-like domain-containing protein [Candidatus Nezhaarchaeales archaeon]
MRPRIIVVLILLTFLLISITSVYAVPSQDFIERDYEVYDDWGVCRTNAYGDVGYMKITPEDNPTTMYPIILEEGLGENAELAWQKGLEFKAQYEDIEERAEAILRYVQENIVYTYDEENSQLPVQGYAEFARNADEMMHSIIEEGVAYGDCEDHAILLATMYMAADIRCAIVVMSNPFEGGHATVLVYLPGYNPGYPVHFFTLNGEWGWVMAEATGDSPLGYVSPDYMMYIENCMNYGFFLYYILEPNQTEQIPKAKYINVDETYEFTLSEEGSEKLFVHLEENKFYNFSLTPITGEVNIKIYDNNGVLIDESSRLGPDNIILQASYTGYHEIYLYGDPQATFQTEVRKIPKPEVTEGGRLTIGEEYQGYVDEGSSIIYIVELQEGEIYRLTVTPQSGDPDIAIYNPWGIPIAESFEVGLTPEVIDFTADSTGDYVIVIYGYLPSTFTLKIEKLQLSWHEITVSEVKQGYVDEDSSIFYVASLEPGEYLIILEPLTGDPDLYVYDEWGYQITSSTNGEGEQDSVAIEVYEPAVCIIEVYGYTSSEYRISVQQYTTSIEEHYISVGETVEDEVSQGASDLYYVELEAFSIYIVTLEPLDGDLDLYVYDPYGLPIAYSELPGVTSEVVVVTTLEEGYYVIEVYGYEASRYVLTIEPLSLSSIRPHGWTKCVV